MTTAVRILTYGCAADHYDEYIKIGKNTTINCLKAFCNAIVAVYAEEYMRPPNETDIARLLEEGEQRGFLGMLGSINYLWIWHALFGMLGSHNDINMLNYSSVFNGIVNGQLPLTIPHPTTTKEKLFVQRQVAARKNVERAFGVLQIKWAITQGPVHYWEKDDLRFIMKTCIILHNMIIEYERHANVGRWTPSPEDAIPIPTLSRCPSVLAAYISSRQLQIRNRETNTRLMNNLMKNLWNRYADEDA
ncbi:uncharacterized protein LOC132281529 [Cornus florida]|uniref:uncharacterized protein LOC132281529 n=1 Tax=Cornus florida TaxID=4283 RepID=UPI0028A2469A|nr:uncharacterized protein LOC132281529 [Cornus florida]